MSRAHLREEGNILSDAGLREQPQENYSIVEISLKGITKISGVAKGLCIAANLRFNEKVNKYLDQVLINKIYVDYTEIIHG
jgi:hypothetical protein